jgi:hypothetical protein
MPSTARKIAAAAVLAGVVALAMGLALALTLAPARSAETATPDDTARFLAGLPPAPDSPLAALTRSPLWEQHARYFNSIFNREDANTLSKVRAFSQAQLTERHDTLLYMFSGPDFLYATSFFPHASTYVLSGLEPVGDVPQLTGLPRGSVDQALRNLESSLGSILNLSFFITHDMKTQLTGGQVYGTLPALYVFLARTGKTVHDVSFVSLDKDGNFLAPDDPAAKGAGRRSARDAAQSTAKGVKIVFSDGSGPMQTLYYFSTNIADDGVGSSGLLPFCAKLGVADSFLKSASYLMHGGGFNKIRSFILNHSATILQDDSGIPLAYFDVKKWRLQPFGHYLAPLSIFPNTFQPEMTELFGNGRAIPLDFGIGYQWRKNESNLLLAQRIGPLAADGSLTPALTIEEDAAVSKSHRKHVEAQPQPSGLRGFLGLFGGSSSPPRPRPPK